MKIQPIVEGQSEEQSLPVLLRRLVADAEAWNVEIARPHRHPRTTLAKKLGIQKAVKIALRTGCEGLLILMDADDDCPKELAPQLASWAQEFAGAVPCQVVLANREYEAWIVAAVVSLRGISRVVPNAEAPTAPEAPRDAKGLLEDLLSDGRYLEVVDQPRLTAQMSLRDPHRTCRSFRKLVGAFCKLVDAASVTRRSEWPPSDWFPTETMLGS